MMSGKVILVSGPTGSGKGTVIDYVRTLYPDLLLSVSCTTRTMRPGEVDGEHYHFLSKEEFTRQVEAGDFLEWAYYGENMYGTRKSEVLPHIEAGQSVLIELEVQGVEQLEKLIPKEQLLKVFIDAGSWEDLAKRVRARAPISDEELEKRRLRYEQELLFKPHADEIIENGEGQREEAKKALADLVGSVLEGVHG